MGTPLKNQNFEKCFTACQRGPKNRPIAKISCTQALKWQRLGWTTEKGSIFYTGPYGMPPLKNKILKIALRSDLRWPNQAQGQNFMTLGLLLASENANRHTNNHDTILKCQIFNMVAAAILDSDLFVKSGAWHHPYLILLGSKEL